MGDMTDKILCPWCGAEMHHCGIKRTYDWEGHEMCGKCGATSPKRWAISQDAVRTQSEAAALRRYTPQIKPMTLEEATGAEDPVWFESTGNVLCVCDCAFTPDMDGGAVEVYMMGRKGYSLLLSRQYGKTWRCWSRKPTDEERSAAGWEK